MTSEVSKTVSPAPIEENIEIMPPVDITEESDCYKLCKLSKFCFICSTFVLTEECLCTACDSAGKTLRVTLLKENKCCNSD